MAKKNLKQLSQQDVVSGLNAYAQRLRERPAIPMNPTAAQEAFAERKRENDARRRIAAVQHSQDAPAAKVRPTGRSAGGWLRRSAFEGTLVLTTVGLLVVTGAVYFGTWTGTQAHEQAMVEVADSEKLANLETDALTIEDTDATAPQALAEQLDRQLADARKAADEIAALQTQFGVLEGDATPGENGAPSSGFLASVEHRRLLAPYFDEATFLIDAEMIYSPTSIFDELGDEEVDPRTAWYVRFGENGKVASGTSYSWQTASVVVADENVNYVDVLWVCRDAQTNAVLAWARGSYDRELGHFVSLQVANTALGDREDAILGGQQ